MFLFEAGFSSDELRGMIARFPPVLGYSISEVLKPKLDFWNDNIRLPLSQLAMFPKYFSFSLDQRIRRRLRIAQKSQHKYGVAYILSCSEEDFVQKFLGIGSLLIPPP